MTSCHAQLLTIRDYYGFILDSNHHPVGAWLCTQHTILTYCLTFFLLECQSVCRCSENVDLLRSQSSGDLRGYVESAEADNFLNAWTACRPSWSSRECCHCWVSEMKSPCSQSCKPWLFRAREEQEEPSRSLLHLVR